MRVNCLSTQEELFETRLLKRVSQPVFLTAEEVPTRLDAPLVLYGNWHTGGFNNGLDWLSEFVFNLPHPTVLLPPFETGALSNRLRLTTALNVQSANTNRLFVLPAAEAMGQIDKNELQVQTDYAFAGPTGKVWVTATQLQLATITLIQPKNTYTPLLLCGARLLSASGLSNNDDRLSLLEGILGWATSWSGASVQIDELPSKVHQLDEATWQVVCILAAGVHVFSAKETISLARSLLGIEISPTDLQLAHDRFVEFGMAQRLGEDLTLNLPALESYSQQHGLWAYVRALRKDFERTQS